MKLQISSASDVQFIETLPRKVEGKEHTPAEDLPPLEPESDSSDAEGEDAGGDGGDEEGRDSKKQLLGIVPLYYIIHSMFHLDTVD